MENKMGTMPVNKLLLTMSLPMMLSMLVQALYNIVDSIFVAKIGEEALTAVSLAFPLQSLMIAAGVGTGVGINALLSKSLGEKDSDKVSKAAHNGLLLTIFWYAVFIVIGLFAVRPFYESQTADTVILDYGVQYLTICCAASGGLFMSITLERLLQSTGKTVYTMISQSFGAVVNMILDPILIFGMFGMPAMGVTGAALATVIGQAAGAVLGIIFNIKCNREIAFSFRSLRVDAATMRQILSVGVPSIIMQSIGSVMVYSVNLILIAYTATATAVFGVYFKLQSFIFMPVFGLNNGVIPIIAYNYGARNRERMQKAIRLAMLYVVGIMAVGNLIMEVFPRQLFMMFDASDHMLSMGIPALRIISILFPFAGVSIVCSAVFQALGNAVYSMIVSITRQLVILLPLVYLLSLLGNVNYIWLGFPISEVLAMLVSLFYMSRIYKNVIRKLEA